MISLNQIIEALTGRNALAGNSRITEFVIDSRKAIPGSFFIALKGDHSDGHNYLENAFRNGAQFALIHKEIPGEYPIVDLRSPSAIQVKTMPKPPFCIRVADTLEALQEIARWWRSNLSIRVIGITGSVGKSRIQAITTMKSGFL